MKTKKVVIKLGTNSISNDDRTLNIDLLKHIGDQVTSVLKDCDVLIVTSGAVGTGIGIMGEKRYDDTTNRQMYAAVGQVELMKIYSELFEKHGKNVAQILATKADFANRSHYLNMKNCLESLLKENITPVMNENDVVSINELMFTDNDELAGLVSKMLAADVLILSTNVDGVLDKDGTLIPEINYDSEIPKHIVDTNEKSSFGKGGIQTKFKMAQEAAKNGTEVYIANSKEPDFILRILNGERVGTKFIPRSL